MLKDIRLYSGTLPLSPASPSQVQIDASNLVISRVVSRPMAFEEIEQRGTVINQNDYRRWNSRSAGSRPSRQPPPGLRAPCCQKRIFQPIVPTPGPGVPDPPIDLFAFSLLNCAVNSRYRDASRYSR